MAICYDVNLEAESLNMSIFKNISGAEIVRVRKVSYRICCSLPSLLMEFGS